MAPLLAATRDGVALKEHHWPADGRARAHLLLVHGIAEHAGRHAHVAARLSRAGIETHAFDLRGFGASGGTRAYVDRWSQFYDDVEDELRAVRGASGDAPVILYGHSMGGLIALGYALSPRPKPDLLVLSAPAVAASVPGWKRALAKVLARALPRFTIANELTKGGLSHDPAVEAAYAVDPLNVHRTTARLGQEFLAEQIRVQGALAGLDRLPVPTYVLHGTDDPIVPVSASALLDGKGNVTRRVYPGLVHETHNEPQAASVIEDTVAYLDGRLRGLVAAR
jgi:acylglycerol lipase